MPGSTLVRCPRRHSDAAQSATRPAHNAEARPRRPRRHLPRERHVRERLRVLDALAQQGRAGVRGAHAVGHAGRVHRGAPAGAGSPRGWRRELDRRRVGAGRVQARARATGVDGRGRDERLRPRAARAQGGDGGGPACSSTTCAAACRCSTCASTSTGSRWASYAAFTASSSRCCPTTSRCGSIRWGFRPTTAGWSSRFDLHGGLEGPQAPGRSEASRGTRDAPRCPLVTSPDLRFRPSCERA
jgi:hypothetical protein